MGKPVDTWWFFQQVFNQPNDDLVRVTGIRGNGWRMGE
jgi:hypothetical protein